MILLIILGLLTLTIIILFRSGWGKHNPNAKLLDNIGKHTSNGMTTPPEPVRMSPLSIRAQRCLSTLNIHNVEELKKISYAQILARQGVGPATAEQIVVWALSEHNIHIPGYGGMTTNGERAEEFYDEVI